MNLNIAILCGYPFPKGLAATNRITTYSRGLVELGSNVKIYIYRPTERKGNLVNNRGKGFFHGIEYEYARNKSIRSSNKILHGFEIVSGYLSILLSIIRDNESDRIDVLLISSDIPIILLLTNWFNKLLKIKSVFIFDEYPKPIRKKLKNEIPWVKKLAYKYILANFDGFISISQNLIDYYLNIVKKHVRTLRISSIVSTERFVKAQKEPNISKYICYMGNLELTKDNVDNIIKAFSLIEKRWSDLYLYIYGKGNTKDMRILKELISSLELNDKVYLKGQVDFEEVPVILKNAKILVSSQPNTIRAQGGFPTKLGEYLATGVPTVMTNVGEINLYIEDKKNAFLVQPEDPREFAEKLDFILRDYNKALVIAKEGQKLIVQNYDSSIQAKYLLDFLMRI